MSKREVKSCAKCGERTTRLVMHDRAAHSRHEVTHGTAVPANRSLPERIMEEVFKIKDTPDEPSGLVTRAPGGAGQMEFRLRLWDGVGQCYKDTRHEHARPQLVEAIRTSQGRGITATVSFLRPGGGYKTLIYAAGRFIGEIKTHDEATWRQINEPGMEEVAAS